MSNIMAKLVGSIFAVILTAGCATTPKDPSITIGSGWVGPEEPANATMFVIPPSFAQAKGFEIAIPSGVAPLGCKTWRDIEGKPVKVCRNAVRALLDGRKASAYPYEGKWYVFATTKPSVVEVISVHGERVSARIVREIDRAAASGDLRGSRGHLQLPVSKDGTVVHGPFGEVSSYARCR